VKIRWSGVLATVLVLVVAGVCIRLGFWQLDRLEQRRKLNAEIAAVSHLPPVPLDGLAVEAIRSAPLEFVHRRARAEGEYLAGQELLLRGRSHDGRPGVHLVVPFQLAGDAGIVLVNRGWVPSADASAADPRMHRLAGSASVYGLLQLVPDAPESSSPLVVGVGDTIVSTFRRLDRRTMAELLGAEPLPVYLQLDSLPPGAAVLPALVPRPALDEGPHLGYAVQWFGFAGVAIFGFAIAFAIRRRETDQDQNPSS
jgi:surfeit locus 1 family protein